MYLYNITIKTDWKIHDKWLPWMKEEHIPQILSYKDFQQYRFYKILEIDESDGPTYALQLFAESKAMCNNFTALHLSAIRKIEQTLWGNAMLCFATLMKDVD